MTMQQLILALHQLTVLGNVHFSRGSEIHLQQARDVTRHAQACPHLAELGPVGPGQLSRILYYETLESDRNAVLPGCWESLPCPWKPCKRPDRPSRRAERREGCPTRVTPE